MPTVPYNHPIDRATAAKVTNKKIIVDLCDGRTIIAPLDWYPRLQNGKPKERNNWRFIGNGIGIHWPDLDEDISISNLLQGQRSGESKKSLADWLKTRKV